LRGPRRRLFQHLLGRHPGIAQKSRQTDLPGAVAAKPPNAKLAASRTDQAAQKVSAPFSSRRSPNRPSPTSIANPPATQQSHGLRRLRRIQHQCVNVVAHKGRG
jgi:hypothetical protein